MALDPAAYRDVVRRALDEDGASSDVTTRAIVPPERGATAIFLAKSPCVVAGLDVAREAFLQLDGRILFDAQKHDGDICRPGEILAAVAGPAHAILSGERTALNLLQQLSGVATLTRRFVDRAAGRVAILDTRKTMPGLRALAKYAVTCGGGQNHRMGLHDGVLIKDNHIRVAGGIAEAVRRVRSTGTTLPIEVEAQSLDDVQAAIETQADVIMLDNLGIAEMRQAVARIAKRARVEISGGVTLERIDELAGIGADCISVGALTHSAPAADISLEILIDDRAAAR
jgi:nicotinate-nucleotide pyrophosphorylase (carboxylating)